ncbi:extracellular solute-binding protein [Cohnella hongkongensis]|uniref:Extracellular solute-binding protein n=1 Tax=Cohnella hongkongensis TaxID=178337 RepID=A0ABV9FHD6_9BACL
MNFKKMGMIAAVLALAATMMAACGNSSGGDSKKITLWAGGSDNVKVMFEKQIENFNKSNPDGYQVQLEFITSGTGAQSLSDRIIAAKKAGQKNTDFDLIELGGDEVLKYVTDGGEDIFVPLDKSKIPNIQNLKFPATFRDDLVVPYRGTTVVLAYNSDTVAEPPTTTQELYQWIKDHPGRFAYNTPGSGGAGGSFVFTSVYNLMPEESMTSVDAKWKDQWKSGFDLMTELHPYLYKSGGKVVYPNKNQGTIDLLANKEVDMIPAWADMIISQVRQGAIPESIKVSQLDPAFTGSTVTLAIPSTGRNPEGAYAFINYMLSPEAQNIALDSMAAIPVIDFADLDPELTKTISSLKIDSFRIGSIGSLSSELNSQWDEQIGTLK